MRENSNRQDAVNQTEKDSIAPCGAVCAECGYYPLQCAGCGKIKGKVYWLKFTGANVCPVYDCCVNNKKQKNCGMCEKLPCEKFTKDPTVSDEQNRENLRAMVQRLKQA